MNRALKISKWFMIIMLVAGALAMYGDATWYIDNTTGSPANWPTFLIYSINDESIIFLLIAILPYTIARVLNTGKFKNFITDAISYTKRRIDNTTSPLDETNGEFYATAEEEIDNGDINRGLWSKALVQAKGDENFRKAIYIELRAKQLKIKNAKDKKCAKEMSQLLTTKRSETLARWKGKHLSEDGWLICEKCNFVATGTDRKQARYIKCPNCDHSMKTHL